MSIMVKFQCMAKNFLVLFMGAILIPIGALAQTAPTNYPIFPDDDSEEPILATLPTLYVKDFSLSANAAKAGDVMRGEFFIESGSEAALSDIFYSVTLNRGNLFIEETPYLKSFFVDPEDRIRKSFFYRLPENLPDGEYSLTIFLLNSKGTTYGFSDPAILDIQGEGVFVALDKLFVIDGKNRYPSAAGFAFPFKSKVVGELRAENFSDLSVEIRPHIKIYRRGTNQEVLQEYDEESLNFIPKGVRFLTYTFPNFTEPEAYLAELVLLNNENKPVSNHALFRWVISGVGAEVLHISSTPVAELENTYDVTVRYAGPADDFVNAGQGELLVKIADQGKIIGQVSEPVVLYGTDQKIIRITATENAVAPEIQAEIRKDQQILDFYSIKQPSLKGGLGQIAFWIIIMVIAVGLIFLAIKIFGTKRKLLVLFFLIAGVILLFGPDNAEADVVVTRNDRDKFGVTWQMPTHNQVFQAGDELIFSGMIWQEGCGNVVKTEDKDKIQFFINNVPLSDFLPLAEADLVACGAGKYCLQYDYRFSIPANFVSGNYKAKILFAGYHPWICQEHPDDPVCQRPAEEQGYFYFKAYEHIIINNPGTEMPTGLSTFCPAPGTRGTVAWFPVQGATFYALRVNDLAGSWTGGCSSPNGDFCVDVATPATSYSFASRADQNYQWWVHACNVSGCGKAAIGSDFMCRSRLLQCSDGIDNDGDGFIDYPNDPGCSSADDDDETNVPLPQCSDGIDNDGDGFIDYPNDPGCSSADDDDETNNGGGTGGGGSGGGSGGGTGGSGTGGGGSQTQCSDNLDNDGDGFIDYPNDPSCFSATDNNENIAFIIDFYAKPNSVIRGSAAELNWSTVGLNSCTINQGIGSVAVNGSRPVSPAQTTTYTLNCLQGPKSNTPIS